MKPGNLSVTLYEIVNKPLVLNSNEGILKQEVVFGRKGNKVNRSYINRVVHIFVLIYHRHDKAFLKPVEGIQKILLMIS